MFKKISIIGLVYGILNSYTATYAAPYTPRSEGDVLIDWGEFLQPHELSKHTNHIEAALQRTENELNKSIMPGQAFRFQIAKNVISRLAISTDLAPALIHKYWVLKARIAQYGHDFDTALSALENAETYQHHVTKFDLESNSLLSARIHLAKGEYNSALRHCLKLLGNSDLLTTMACTLEVKANHDDLESSYFQLKRLIDTHGLPGDERDSWIRQILADLAVRVDRLEEAQKWLEPLGPNKLPVGMMVSYIKQWCDIHLAQKQYHVVINALRAILEETSRSNRNFDDALLLRYVIALKESSKSGELEQSQLLSYWYTVLEKRIQLREQRLDTEHAADIAIFYLDVQPNAERALHWAQLNYNLVKDYQDMHILNRAISQVEFNNE